MQEKPSSYKEKGVTAYSTHFFGSEKWHAIKRFIVDIPSSLKISVLHFCLAKEARSVWPEEDWKIGRYPFLKWMQPSSFLNDALSTCHKLFF